jgi:hypothetical protein
MPSASHDQIELREIAPGYSSRFADWGGITVAFEEAQAGQDASALVRGLPDDRRVRRAGASSLVSFDRHAEHDLADVALVREGLLRLSSLFKRIRRGYTRTDLASLDVTHKVTEEAGRRDRGAGEREVGEVDRAQVEFDKRAADGTRDRVAAAAA